MTRDTYSSDTTRPHHPRSDAAEAASFLATIARRFTNERASAKEVADAFAGFQRVALPASALPHTVTSGQHQSPGRRHWTWEDADDTATADALRTLLRREPTLKEVTAMQKACAPKGQPLIAALAGDDAPAQGVQPCA